jgi:hypothetical protein
MGFAEPGGHIVLHPERACVPAGGTQATQHAFGGCLFIRVEKLRIVLASEASDFLCIQLMRAKLDASPYLEKFIKRHGSPRVCGT